MGPYRRNCCERHGQHTQVGRPRISVEPRLQILDAAGSVIAQRGIAETRISDIAERLDLSPSLILYYLSSKEELFEATLRHHYERFIDRERALWLEMWAEARRDPEMAAIRPAISQGSFCPYSDRQRLLNDESNKLTWTGAMPVTCTAVRRTLTRRAAPLTPTLPRMSRLNEMLAERAAELRPPEVVMAPAQIGATRLTRYSFSRTMLRRAVSEGWALDDPILDLDDAGRGEVIYRVEAGDHVFHFVGFLTHLDESEHTDRVVADRWEIAAALVEGEIDEAFLSELRANVPAQEDGRFDARTLVLTRGNRSVRFYDYLVDELAAGRQPDPAKVGDAGYIMRSTAFYGNGKYGMRSWAGYSADHPLAAPYRSQMLCAWLFRETSYLAVEHAARAKGGDAAVAFNAEWSRFFGLGNATGLGIVVYGFKHPHIVNAWNGVRELALANVRALPGTPDRRAEVTRWIDKAEGHFRLGSADDATPFLSPQQLAPLVDSIRSAWAELQDDERPFDSLMRWAETQHVEVAELIVSILVELDEAVDAEVDELLRVEEHGLLDLGITVGETRDLIETRFGWLADLDLDQDDASHYWWVISDNTEEPRRTPHTAIPPDGRDIAIDAANDLWRLRASLNGVADFVTLASHLAEHPHHLHAAHRLLDDPGPYGEPRDNCCAKSYLPLQIQRFQLAMYGMDNYKPKSTDWLRVTLFQGAPRVAELPDAPSDDWVFPVHPAPEGTTT